MKKMLLSFATLFLSVSGLFCQVSFEKHQIGSPAQPRDVRVCDIDGDGDYDLATVCNANGEVAWWQNNGAGIFSKNVISTGFTGIRTIRAGDLNADGSIDLVAGVVNEGRIMWWQNDGSQNFTQKVLDGSFAGAHTVQITDLDQDGDADVMCSGWDNTPALSEIAWWENNGNAVFTKHVISGRFQQSPFMLAEDMDLDGDLDIVACCEALGVVSWFENNGSQTFTEHVVDGNLTSAHTLAVKDVNKDGLPDILGSACLANKQAWYLNKGDGTFVKTDLPDLAWTMWLEGSDFDLDGDIDLVATGMNANSLAFYTNNGQEKFTQSWIPGSIASGFAMQIIDLDQDQDDDIILVGYNSNFLGWWENTTDRLSLLKSPRWITPGEESGEFYVANDYGGSIIKCSGEVPQFGIRSLGALGDIEYQNGIIWTTYGSELIGIDAVSGITRESVRSSAMMLKSIVEAPDGRMYITYPAGGSIWRFDPASIDLQMWVSGLTYPQVAGHDPVNNQLIVMDGEETVDLKAVDYTNGGIDLIMSTQIEAGGDLAFDLAGNMFVSSPNQNKVYRFKTADFRDPVEFDGEFGGPSGLWFDDQRNELYIAEYSGDCIGCYPVDFSGVEEKMMAPGILVYPNPAGEIFHVEVNDFYQGQTLYIRDANGRMIDSYSLIQKELCITTRKLSQGLYYIELYNGHISITSPIIITK